MPKERRPHAAEPVEDPLLGAIEELVDTCGQEPSERDVSEVSQRRIRLATPVAARD